MRPRQPHEAEGLAKLHSLLPRTPEGFFEHEVPKVEGHQTCERYLHVVGERGARSRVLRDNILDVLDREGKSPEQAAYDLLRAAEHAHTPGHALDRAKAVRDLCEGTGYALDQDPMLERALLEVEAKAYDRIRSRYLMDLKIRLENRYLDTLDPLLAIFDLKIDDLLGPGGLNVAAILRRDGLAERIAVYHPDTADAITHVREFGQKMIDALDSISKLPQVNQDTGLN